MYSIALWKTVLNKTSNYKHQANGFNETGIAQSLVFCVEFCRSVFVLFLFFIWSFCFDLFSKNVILS